jgi:23S rRNA pseudouridine2604 synthase
MSQTDDPWAKWRKPEAAAEADDGKPAQKTPKQAPQQAPRRAADKKGAGKKAADKIAPETLPAMPAEAARLGAEPHAPVSTSGRLSVAKSVAGAEGAARKRPVRGGALTRRPKPAAALAESTGDAVAEPVKTAYSKWGEARAGEKRGPLKPRADGARGSAKYGTKDSDSARKTPADRLPGKKPAGAFGGKSPAEGKPAAGEMRFGRGKAEPEKSPARSFVPREKPPAAKPLPVAAPAPSGVRLSKIMVERGLASRREADLWIERGWVWVDGERIGQLGARIAPEAQIEVRQDAGPTSVPAPREVTFLLHKPAGYSCEWSGAKGGEQVALTLLTEENRVAQPGDPALQPWMLRNLVAAGNLETGASGLLVLTRSGGTARRLLADERELEREYLVRISGELSRKDLELLREGLPLNGRALGKTWVKQLDPGQLHFIVREGQTRPLQRMCEAVGLNVKSVQRTRIGHLRLGKLAAGQWRFLRADENV